MTQPLNFKEAALVKKYFNLGKNAKATADALGIGTSTLSCYLSKPHIATAIANKDLEFSQYLQHQNEAGLITYAEKIHKLTEIVDYNMEKIIDDSGVEKMRDAKVSVTALNSLIKAQGHFVSVKQELALEVKDNRSEQEIRDNIVRLTQEYNELIAIEGETIND